MKIKNILEKYNAKIPYLSKNLLSLYVLDSLAFVQFIVDVEEALSVKVPFGSFDLSLLDKSISEVEIFIKTIIKNQGEEK